MATVTAWVLGPLALSATWIVCACASTAIGLAVRAFVLPAAPLSWRGLLACFWSGTAATVLLLQAWHLFLPVGGAAAIPLLAVGAAGLVAQRRPLLTWWRNARLALPIGVVATVLLLFWWMGAQGLGQVASFDTYMYHMPAVDWLRQHGIVPGLANLQERLGFNNASFLLAALLESGPWTGGSPHLLNGIMLVPALALGLTALFERTKDAQLPSENVFDLVLLAPTLAIACDPVLFRGLGPDAPASLAMFAGTSFLLRAIADRGSEPERAFFRVTAVGAFAAGAAFKLSVAAAAVPFAAAALWSLVRTGEARAIGAAATLGLGIGLLWLARGAVLSGYPLYPSTAFALPVDWRVPEEQARASYEWVSFFARHFADPETYNRGVAPPPCGALSWIGPWTRDLTHPSSFWRITLPALLAAGFAAIAATAPAQRARTVPSSLLLPLLVALALWFAVAPRPLFGFWIPWIAAALLAALVAPRFGGVRTVRGIALVGAAVTMALPLLGRGLDAARATDASNLRAVLSAWRVPADPVRWIEPTRWEYPLSPYTTSSGLVLLVPQGHRCGRAPLNCTSHPAINLEQRRPGNLGAGFRVNGAWQAERWPNPWNGFLPNWRAGVRCG